MLDIDSFLNHTEDFENNKMKQHCFSPVLWQPTFLFNLIFYVGWKSVTQIKTNTNWHWSSNLSAQTIHILITELLVSSLSLFSARCEELKEQYSWVMLSDFQNHCTFIMEYTVFFLCNTLHSRGMLSVFSLEAVKSRQTQQQETARWRRLQE